MVDNTSPSNEGRGRTVPRVGMIDPVLTQGTDGPIVASIDDYNTAKTNFSANPDDIWAIGKIVKTYGDSLSHDFIGIHTMWDELQLGWTGKSATDANDFSEKYHNAVTDFFGETQPTDPTKPDGDQKVVKDGVLSHFSSGLMGAGSLYGQTEINIYYAFKWFADMLDNPNFDPTTDPLRPGANVTPPNKNDKPAASPPVLESDSGDSKPWFKVGDKVTADWSWTQDNPDDPSGKTLWQIDVKAGSVWTGHEGDGTTITVINKDDNK